MNSTHVGSFSHHHRTEVDSIRYLVGGGFFTGRYTSMNTTSEAGSRFDPEQRQGKVRNQTEIHLSEININIWWIETNSFTVKGQLRYMLRSEEPI